MNRVFKLDKSFEDLDLLVVEWAREKGILQVADAKSQALKMVSEVGELCDAVAKGDMVNIIDRKSTRLNSSHIPLSRMPSSA